MMEEADEAAQIMLDRHYLPISKQAGPSRIQLDTCGQLVVYKAHATDQGMELLNMSCTLNLHTKSLYSLSVSVCQKAALQYFEQFLQSQQLDCSSKAITQLSSFIRSLLVGRGSSSNN